MSLTLTSTVASEAERVELLICTPHQPVRKVSAKLSGHVRALQILWQNSPKKFIYNGQELLETMTFSFYGIKDGESIIALPKIEFNDDLECWKKVSMNRLEFNELVRSMTNPKTSREMARLRDLRFIGIEKKLHVYHKLKKAFEEDNFENIHFSEKDSFRKIDQASNDNLILESNLFAPSEDALPILW